MTEIEYLRAHPLDLVLAGGKARVRMFACPSVTEGCDSHPVLQMHEPADEPDDSAMGGALPFREVAGALGWLLKTASAMMFDAIDLRSESAERADEFERSGIQLAAATAKYHDEMSAAIAKSLLN